MTTRLGLAIGSGEVRAALARGRSIVWTGARPVIDRDRLADVVADTLRSAPLRRFPRTPVVAALGPGSVQVKRLAGVAVTARSPVVHQLVRVNSDRFFLRNGVPLAVASVHRDGDSWWGAAMDAPAVAAVQDGCAAGPVFLEGCVPALTAIATSVGHPVDCELDLSDGQIRARLCIEKGRWSAVRRVRTLKTEEPTGAPALARIGVEPRFADAAAAALSSPRSPLFLRATRSRVTRRQARFVRFMLVALAVTSLAAVLLAPALSASRSAVRDGARLQALRGTLDEWSPALAQLRHTTSALNEIGRFGEQRRSTALLLGAISKALPDFTAIVSLRVDSAAGTMTLLSLAASSIVPRLVSDAGVFDPRIVGAVTRESVNGRQLQRVTVRFQLRGATR